MVREAGESFDAREYTNHRHTRYWCCSRWKPWAPFLFWDMYVDNNGNMVMKWVRGAGAVGVAGRHEVGSKIVRLEEVVKIGCSCPLSKAHHHNEGATESILYISAMSRLMSLEACWRQG